jgi:hypothetical protein
MLGATTSIGKGALTRQWDVWTMALEEDPSCSSYIDAGVSASLHKKLQSLRDSQARVHVYNVLQHSRAHCVWHCCSDWGPLCSKPCSYACRLLFLLAVTSRGTSALVVVHMINGGEACRRMKGGSCCSLS